MLSLEELADHPAIVFPAYIAALLPLTVLYGLDFITEKWKTVAHTRRTGHIYLFSSIPLLFFVVFYIHLQRAKEDYKEMAAAISAAIFSIVHILRTLWGLVQLDAFKQWNKRALRCLNNMGYGAPVYEFVPKNHDWKDDDRNWSRTSTRNSEDGLAGGTRTSDVTGNDPDHETCTRTTQTCFAIVKKLVFSASNNLVSIFTRGDRYLVSIFKPADRYKESKLKRRNLIESELGMTVDKHMMVNSSLVDNEFRSAELRCRLKNASLARAIWALVTRGTTFRVSDYVECEMPVECSVRWLVVFVARFGSQWLTEKSNLGRLEKYDHLPFDEQKKVFRRRVGALGAMRTTFDEVETISVFCPGSPLMKTPSNQEYLRLTKSDRAELPYQCSGYEGDRDIAFERLSASVKEIILGWDRSALRILGSDERKSVERMSSSEISCFAKMMSLRLPGSHLVREDWRGVTISEQIGDSDSKEQEQFSSLVPTNTTLYRQTLWKGRYENKLVDQACVHIDNWAALECARRLKRSTPPDVISGTLRGSGKDTFLAHKTLEMRAHEYDFSRDETVETRAAWDIVFLGSVMESVRAFMAHSVAGLSAASIENINWSPRIDRKIFPFQCSRQLLNCLRESRNGASGAGTGIEEGPRAWNVETRLLWELQQSFHNAVSTLADENVSGGLVELNELMILCMLGFPCLELSKKRQTVNDKSATRTESQETVYQYSNDTVLTLREDSCDTERAFFCVKPVQGPQPMWLIVSVDFATGTGEVEVVVGDNGTTSNVFDWQAWKDSFMGRLQGQAGWRKKMVGPEVLRPREEALESILSTPIMNLPGYVKQWGGWPPLYPRMSMISKDGKFGAEGNDCAYVEEAMDAAAREWEEDDISMSAGRRAAETLRARAQIAKQEGRSSESLTHLCKCISCHEDPAALDEMLLLLRENRGDFVKKHITLIAPCIGSVLASRIESSRKRSAGREESETATIRLEQLALCFSSLHQICPEHELFPEGQTRCLFELRDPRFLRILEEYRAKMIIRRDALLPAAVYCFDQCNISGESHMRLLGEGYLETFALHTSSRDIALSTGYLLEKGILRGRQTVYLEALRTQRIGPHLSIEETARHFVAHNRDGLHVLRKSTPAAVRIYERHIETKGGSSDLWNRLGLVYLLDSSGLQNLRRAEALLNRAKRENSKDAMCNLAVLHGFYRGRWDLAEQNLTNAIPENDVVPKSDTLLLSNSFNYPVPECVSINGHVYNIWDESDISQNPHTSSMNNLAVLYEVEDSSFGDVQQALELYERILEVDENPVALLNMTMLLKLGPVAVRDEIRSGILIRALQSRLLDYEHMPVFEKSIRQLMAFSSSGAEHKWILTVHELENCAVLVKQLDEQS